MKKIVSIFIMMCIILGMPSAFPIISSAETGEIFKYIVENGEVTITGCDENASGNIEIPLTIDGCPVTAIASGAFENCSLITAITISENISYIGKNAFLNCSKLSKVNTTNITAWFNIDFENHYANPLYYAEKLHLNGLSFLGGFSIADGIKEIKDYAFCGADYSKIFIDDGVERIGKEAFYNCTMEEIVIPKSVAIIEEGAFSGCCNLETIYYKGNKNEWDGIELGDDNEALETAEVYKGYRETYRENGLNYRIYEEYAELISDEVYRFALEGVSSEIEIPNTVKGVPVTKINGFNSSFITSVIIPETVKEIVNDSFSSCGHLKSVYYKGNEEQFRNLFQEDIDVVFSKVVVYYNFVEFYTENNITYAIFADYAKVLSGNEGESGVAEISAKVKGISVTIIEKNAFYLCRNLKGVIIPYTITFIGKEAFGGSCGMENIYYRGTKDEWDKITKENSSDIPFINSVKYYEFLEIYTENELEYVICRNGATLASASTAIEEEVYIPETVKNIPLTTIGKNAFNKCGKMTSIWLAESITVINKNAFSQCTNLEKSYYLGTEEQWNEVYVGTNNHDLIHNLRVIKSQKTRTTTQKTDVGTEFAVSSVGLDIGDVVCVAVYDGKRLKAIMYKAYSGEDLTFDTSEVYDSAKVLVLDGVSTLRPLAIAEEVEF